MCIQHLLHAAYAAGASHEPSSYASRMARRLGGLAVVAATLLLLAVASGCGGDDQSSGYKYCTTDRTGVHCRTIPTGSSVRPDDSQDRLNDLYGGE
jgi:hypothetical protein